VSLEENALDYIANVSCSADVVYAGGTYLMDGIIHVIIASLLSGLLGVIVTLLVQRHMAKKAEQLALFKTLMCIRFVYGASYEKTRALNLIDVVFYNATGVLSAWGNLYDSYCKKEPDATAEEIEDNTLALLEAMAKHLDYKNLDWKKIKKSYLPVGISNDMKNQAEQQQLQLDFLRLLSGSNFSDQIQPMMQKIMNNNPTPTPKNHGGTKKMR